MRSALSIALAAVVAVAGHTVIAQPTPGAAAKVDAVFAKWTRETPG